MSQFPEPAEQLKDTPLRFLESEQFQEMLDTYNKLKPLEKEHPRKFKNQMNVFDFGDIYPLMDSYLQTHDLSSPEAVAEAVTIGASETVTDGHFLRYALPACPDGIRCAGQQPRHLFHLRRLGEYEARQGISSLLQRHHRDLFRA